MAYKRQYLALAMMLLEVVVILLLSFGVRDTEYLGRSETVAQIPLGGIIHGMEISQTFPVKKGSFSALDISIATFSRVNDSSLELELYQNDELLFSRNVDAKTITDNAFLRFTWKEELSNGLYKLKIYSKDASPQNSVTCWVSETGLEEEILYVNANLVQGAITIVPIYQMSGWDFLKTAFQRMSINTISIVNPVLLSIFFLSWLFVANLLLVGIFCLSKKA